MSRIDGPTGVATPGRNTVANEDSDLAQHVAALFGRRPVVGGVVAVVHDGVVEYVRHGWADIAERRPATEHTVFRIASITKTFTAIAIMQLWERGLLDLDAPVRNYLRGYRLAPTDPEFGPVTVRHLLTHTSGIGETAHPWRVLGPDFGESVPPGAPVTPLADYYRQGLRVDAEPGTRWTYTNHGFATLGQVVADITGVAFADYLHTHIFQALGMFDTTMVSGEVSTRDRATGYTLGARGPVPVTHREMITAPASSAYSTAHDMTRYLAALLNGGRNDHGRILQSDTLATMFAPQYQPDPRIPGIGLGLFRGLVGDRSVVEHQGILPGFNAQMWLSPADRTGVLSLVTGGHRALLWLPAETSTLLHQVLGVQEPRIRTDVPHRPEVWPDICGSYRLPGSLTDVRARGMVGAGAEVRISGGRPVLRVLTPIPALLRGLPLHPDDRDDPWAYRLDLTRFGLGTGRILFGRDARTGRHTMYFDLHPLTMERRKRG
ncbi:serine hydrolase domain-containing protein [Nocardia wallacei]|uniref:serine hydrolase domain-containing protein n=1 Tax=Nocardia wallacei TaxID=480035 RepID=UPI0024590FC0|nr:serine hydrolase domain-containing protein [Nocardia wallacei]